MLFSDYSIDLVQIRRPTMKFQRVLCSALLVTYGLIPFSASAQIEERVHTTAETLLARIQVEDFMNDYYWELASESTRELDVFWTEDAEFDVNGQVYQGLAAIEAVYALGLGPGGRLVFQMDIPKIRINGKEAVVDLIYTGVLNTDPAAAPRLYEQGHDHVELVSNNGDWKITRRVLRTISLDESFPE
jgi:hypothetical protein